MKDLTPFQKLVLYLLSVIVLFQFSIFAALLQWYVGSWIAGAAGSLLFIFVIVYRITDPKFGAHRDE